MIKKLFALCMVLALVSPVLAATSDDMRDPLSWILSLGKGKSGGSQGPQGDPGPAGPQGAVLYVDCGENQCIMNQTPNQTAGPRGLQGIQGPQGIPGEPADILVNFTETVDPGENAYVVDVGEPGLAKLDFKIPRGFPGAKGDTGYRGPEGEQGIQGIQGPQGIQGIQGNPGINGINGQNGISPTVNANYTFTLGYGYPAAVNNVGSLNDALFDFYIPAGPQGDPGQDGTNGEDGTNGTNGEDGVDGAAATIAVNYTFTGAAGSSASVINIGSSSAALFDFIIPQGAKGDTGTKGDTGNTGPKGDTGDPGTCNLSTAYPVGSIYISTVSTNPNTLFGVGTWAAFGTGRVLVGIDAGDTMFDVVEETGGAKTVASAGTVGSIAQSATANVKGGTTTTNTVADDIHTHPAPSFTGSATSVLDPYIVVYMWERTA